MTFHVAATPFGARRLSAAQVRAQATAEACPPEASADKWRILKAVTEARSRLGISDRAAAVLGALLSFHPGETIAPGAIVFPSNRVLSLRAHGMSAPTLRRHIAALVEAGLVIRRDSPNGKRYARKGEDGAIALAFGFELTPLVARAAEFEAAAAALRAEARDCAALRERVSVLRRDLVKTAALVAETVPGFSAEDHCAGLLPLLAGPLRGRGPDALASLAYDLGLALAALAKRLEPLLKSEKTNASAAHGERHIQNSNQTISESEPLREKERAESVAAGRDAGTPGERQGDAPGSGDAGRAGGGAAGAGGAPGRGAEPPRIDLSAVLAACPDLRDWSPAPVRSWDDLVRAAETVRPALGISPDAWAEAVAAMGGGGAAVTLATMLQRAAEIASPGGYLRALTAKARSGGFSPAPVVVSLLRRRARADADGGAGAGGVVRVQRS